MHTSCCFDEGLTANFKYFPFSRGMWTATLHDSLPCRQRQGATKADYALLACRFHAHTLGTWIVQCLPDLTLYSRLALGVQAKQSCARAGHAHFDAPAAAKRKSLEALSDQQHHCMVTRRRRHSDLDAAPLQAPDEHDGNLNKKRKSPSPAE